MLIAQNEAEELPTVTVNPYFSFDPVTKSVSEMKQHLNEFSNDELVKVAKTGECGTTKNIFFIVNPRKISTYHHHYHVNTLIFLL